ncbi:MAG: hypothetical protein KDB35_18325 [Acidimicrobiales bacterium]|nr:hypothetical protein [Acidimicrobiales bacterium]
MRGSRTLGRLTVTLGLVAALLLALASPAWAATPPGRQATGYGSTAGYVSAGATRFEAGSANDGTKVWWWVPTTLRDGASAPVVVYLHGFSLTDPEPYQPHIDHLTRQGYIVVYPQFNLTGLGIFNDNNQNVMLSRAIAATQGALGSLGAQAGPLHLFGHSLGGLLSASWMGAGGPAVDSVTLANPSTGAGAPSFVTIVPIDWQQAAPATTARTMILTGDDDTIAPPSESLGLFAALTGASSRVVYQAHTDGRGSPGLDADHMSPIQSSGGIPNFLLQFFGGTAEQDAMDWRYYWAALDANLDGQRSITHDLGAWSDGVPVAAPSVLAADLPGVPGAPAVTTSPGPGLVQVGWQAPGDDGGAPITGYRVIRDNATIATTGPGATTATDQPVDCGRHEYRVVAANDVGEGPPSAVSVAVVPCRPDAEIAGSRTGPFVGADLYRDTPGATQLQTAPVAKRSTAVFPVRIGNDGEVTSSFRLAAAVSGAPTGFRVRVVRAGQDITDEVLAGTYVVADLAPGATATVKVKVTAFRRSTWGSSRKVDLTAASTATPALVDVVRARAVRR